MDPDRDDQVRLILFRKTDVTVPTRSFALEARLRVVLLPDAKL